MAKPIAAHSVKEKVQNAQPSKAIRQPSSNAQKKRSYTPPKQAQKDSDEAALGISGQKVGKHL